MERVHSYPPDRMAKPSSKNGSRAGGSARKSGGNESCPHAVFRRLLTGPWTPLLLAAITFLVYGPSLRSDFVYDARIEILQEGFVTSLANLPAILSLKVLGMNLQSGFRPGELLYLMLNAAVWGKDPFGYHLSSNLIHAANVALLFVLLRRLMATELTGLTGNEALKVQLAAVTVTLIFALHPIAVESVAEVSYASTLLVMFFALLVLLAAIAFRPQNFRNAIFTGAFGTFCVFAAVTCKESGLTLVLLLIVYRYLFRRQDRKGPWLWFLGGAMAVTAAFLAARFLLPPPYRDTYHYLGGSFFHVFLIQPQLWVFMMGKLVWPVNLSADYALVDLSGPSLPLSLIILAVVVSLQTWLAFESRIGALGMAFYWLGLGTVSNFVPLYRILADRFYYLPLAGVAMQLLAVFLLLLKWRWGFWMLLAPVLAALVPLTALTLKRQNAFANEFSLWSDTLQANPLSTIAYAKLAAVLFDRGEVNEAIADYQRALEISPDAAEIRSNLGSLYFHLGDIDAAIGQFQRAVASEPHYALARYNLGVALSQKGSTSEAIAQFREALRLRPDFSAAQIGLKKAQAGSGQSP